MLTPDNIVATPASRKALESRAVLPRALARCGSKADRWSRARHAGGTTGLYLKKRIGVVLTTLTVLGALAPAATADPSFAAGNSGGGPNDANAKCLPPGQTTE